MSRTTRFITIMKTNKEIDIPALSRDEQGKLRGGFAVMSCKPSELDVTIKNGNCFSQSQSKTSDIVVENSNCIARCGCGSNNEQQ